MSITSPTIPHHIGIIPDGNRRWGEDNGISKVKAYELGYNTMMKVARAAIDRGVQYLTAYAFSTENWDRPPDEVKYIMDLTLRAVVNEVNELHAKNIRLRFIGSRENLSSKLVKAMDAAEQKTASNSKGTFSLCFNYGGQHEILDAVRKIVATGYNMDKLSNETFGQFLYTPDIPAVDLIIRSSGEQRSSGFMLWRAAYAEYYFVEKNWPDFQIEDLDAAIADYARRQRRFGR